MDIDDRITKIEQGHKEHVAWVRESQAKNEAILADILDSIKRLERIALSHEVRLQDTEATLAALEGRMKRPQ